MAAAGPAARSIYRLFVNNIPWTVSSQDLKHHFSKYGHVSSAMVVFDRGTGLSRNYGFVVYSKQKAYDLATHVSAHHLEGSVLKVFPANG